MAINMWQWYPSAIKCMSVDDWILGVYWKYVGFLSRLIENCLVDGHAIVRNDRWLWNLLLVGNRNAWLYMTISMKTCLNWKRWKREQECRCAGARPVDFEAFLEPFELAGSTLVRHVRHVRRWFDMFDQVCQSLCQSPGRSCASCSVRSMSSMSCCAELPSLQSAAPCQAIRFHRLSLTKRSKRSEGVKYRMVPWHCNDIAMTSHLWHLVTSCVFEKCDECDEKCDHNVTISMWQCDLIRFDPIWSDYWP